jgi:hypothetical protein
VCPVLARQITSDLFAIQGMALTTFACTAAKVRLGQAAMGQPETKVEDLCVELGVPGRHSTATWPRTDPCGLMVSVCSTAKGPHQADR